MLAILEQIELENWNRFNQILLKQILIFFFFFASYETI